MNANKPSTQNGDEQRNASVSNNVASLRLQDAWRECERNVYYMCRALTSLDPILPMTGARFAHLTDAQVQIGSEVNRLNCFFG